MEPLIALLAERQTGADPRGSALREAEAKHLRLVEGLEQEYFFYARDANGVFQYLSPSVAGVLGYSPDEFLTHYTKYLTDHPVNQEVVRRTGLSILGIPQPPYPVEIRHKDGSIRRLEVTEVPVRGPDGRVAGVEGLARDITARWQVEEALRDSEERYRTLFEGARDGMALADAATGRLLECNAALCRMVERDRAELVGQVQTILHPPQEHARKFSPSFQQHREGGIGLTLEDELVSKSGRLVPVEINAARVRMNGRDYLMGVFRDITARRKSEEALRASREQLRRAQKLEAVGQLAGGVAHEFNNLLMGIGGYAQLLMERPAPDPSGAAGRAQPDAEAARDLARIRELANRGADLSRQLLAFSRREPREPVDLDLNALIENARQMLRRLLPENIELEVAAAPDLGVVRADPGQIEQVFMNLAVNARDAMPRGGRLRIETGNSAAGGSPGQKPATAHVVMTVADTGVGMDQATQRRLFEPFFTTKEVGKGTGLGLATVYGIVKQHGGHITVHSEPGRGSAFRVHLPRLSAFGGRLPEAPAMDNRPPTGGAPAAGG